jgi:two-component system, NarL family, response regulator DevR
MQEGQIRLLVVEDSAALAEALVFAFGFEDGIEPVGVAPTVSRALEMVTSEQPDVVLMDVRLPDGSGIEAVPRVMESLPVTRVIVMTAHADTLVALDAADSGAAGFLLKDVRIAKVVAGVRKVVTEALAVDPVMLEAMLAEAKAGGSGDIELSASECEVVALLAEGLDRQAIAARLGTDEIEVVGRAAAMREHLGARSNLEAVVRAARAGLLDPDQGSRARISNR